jgi:hypothetical protein
MLSPEQLAEVIGGAIEGILGAALAGMRTRLAVLEARAEFAPDAKSRGALGERLAALEARPAVPGPAGKDGAPGAAGVDGLGFGDLVLEQVNDRDLVVKAMVGDRVRELGRVSWPVMLDAGVWAAGRAYAKGDAVTYGGSLWVCQQAGATARPETAEGARAWRLAVKRGRDGRGDRV